MDICSQMKVTTNPALCLCADADMLAELSEHLDPQSKASMLLSRGPLLTLRPGRVVTETQSSPEDALDRSSRNNLYAYMVNHLPPRLSMSGLPTAPSCKKPNFNICSSSTHLGLIRGTMLSLTTLRRISLLFVASPSTLILAHLVN